MCAGVVHASVVSTVVSPHVVLISGFLWEAPASSGSPIFSVATAPLNSMDYHSYFPDGTVCIYKKETVRNRDMSKDMC